MGCIRSQQNLLVETSITTQNSVLTCQFMFYYHADVVVVFLESVLKDDGVGWPELEVECKYFTTAAGGLWYARGEW